MSATLYKTTALGIQFEPIPTPGMVLPVMEEAIGLPDLDAPAHLDRLGQVLRGLVLLPVLSLFGSAHLPHG